MKTFYVNRVMLLLKRNLLHLQKHLFSNDEVYCFVILYFILSILHFLPIGIPQSTTFKINFFALHNELVIINN